MYHDVHVLILSDMYIHVHTCVHVHTYVVFVCTYVCRYIYVCTHMCTLTHIREPSIPLNKKIGLTCREKRQEHITKSHANKSKCLNKNMVYPPISFPIPHILVLQDKSQFFIIFTISNLSRETFFLVLLTSSFLLRHEMIPQILLL